MIPVHKKPFVALARMVLYPEDYWRGDYERKTETDVPPAVKPRAKNAPFTLKESQNEVEEAARIAKAILAYNNLAPPEKVDVTYDENGLPVSWSIPECKPLSSCSTSGDRSQGVKQEAWYEVGDEYINVPEFDVLSM